SERLARHGRSLRAAPEAREHDHAHAGSPALAESRRVIRPAIPERVLVAPDSFKGTFRATEVAAAIGRGLEAAGLAPPDLCPVADGGEGTLEVLLTALGGETAGI